VNDKGSCQYGIILALSEVVLSVLKTHSGVVVDNLSLNEAIDMA